MREVGERLRRLRKEKGLTQTAVTGGRYSKEYVSQVELGKTKPSRKAIQLFAKHLEVDESYFDSGIEPEGRDRYESLMAMGAVQLARREAAEAERTFTEAGAIAERAANGDMIWRSNVERAWALHHLGRYAEASALLDQARRHDDGRDPRSDEAALVLYRLGRVREALGDLELAVLLLGAALTACERAKPKADRLRLQVLRALTCILGKTGDTQAAIDAATRALELARCLEDREAVAAAYWDAALLEERRGEFRRAAEHALRARDILTDLGDRHETAKLLKELGDITIRTGRSDIAVRYFHEGLELLGGRNDSAVRAGLLSGLAEARLELGDSGAAFRCVEESLSLLGENPEEAVAIGVSRLLLARAHLAEGRFGDCRREIESAKDRFEQAAADRELSASLLLEGDVLLMEGLIESAAAAFRRSSEIARDARR